MNRLAVAAGLVGFTLACARQGDGFSANRRSTPSPGDLELNFVGVSVANWPESYKFYTDTLGVRTEARNGSWAMLGAGWDAYLTGRSRGMVFELFDGGPSPSSDRVWGRGQAVRPSIQVEDLEAAVAMARAGGVHFTGAIEITEWGRRIEFSAAEGVRWTLSHRTGGKGGQALSRPLIGLAEVKTADLARQTAFYRDVMGMRVESAHATRVVLRQAASEPQLVLEHGPADPTRQAPRRDRPTGSQPVFLSFMTDNLRQTAARLRTAQVTVLAEIAHHDWEGTDFIVADADGNPIQIVEYDDHRRFGATAAPAKN